ncbi:MAG TPA: malate dehydrogenase [Anaerolineales bacterium]|nr:malate dehydrogenase [Anaerolineales bacterium]HRF46547.1 malate dehydrogenase [Anaerolineales bacterium]
MRKKVTVVGAGNVGASCALWLAQRGICDVVLVDAEIAKTAPVGKSLDLLQAAPIVGYNARIMGTANGSYEGTENSDVIVITAGFPRKPGMSREDLVSANQGIITDVLGKALAKSPNAYIVVVTNPLDSMTYLAYKLSGLPKHRVMGQAGILDSARMAAFIALEMNVSIENVQTVVLGGHGDEMVPLTRYSTVFGRPITEWLSPEKVNAIVDRTRKGGGEIVNLLGTSAYYAPGAAAARMAEAILLDSKLIVPASAYLEGEFGYNDIYFGVPVKLGAGGVEEILQFPLTDEEKAMADKSVKLIRETMGALKF